MTHSLRIAAVMTVALGVAAGAGAQEKSSPTAAEQAAERALVAAMTPGEGQKRLDSLAGAFDVKVRVWLIPPEASGSFGDVGCHVGARQPLRAANAVGIHIGGEPWSDISYAGFDNVTKKYVSTYMDTGSTGMKWYTGTLDADGRRGRMTATIADEVTGKPKTLELRLGIAANGDHVTGAGRGTCKARSSRSWSWSSREEVVKRRTRADCHDAIPVSKVPLAEGPARRPCPALVRGPGLGRLRRPAPEPAAVAYEQLARGGGCYVNALRSVSTYC